MQLLASCAQGVSILKVAMRHVPPTHEVACRIMTCLRIVLGQATCGIRLLALEYLPFDAQIAMLLTAGLAENQSVRQLQFNRLRHGTTSVNDGMNVLLQFLASQDRIQRLQLLDRTVLDGRMVGQLAAAATSLTTLIYKGPFRNAHCVREFLEEIPVLPHLKRLELLKLTHRYVDDLSRRVMRLTALRFLTVSFTTEGAGNEVWGNDDDDFNERSDEVSLSYKLRCLVSSLQMNDSLQEFVLQDEYRRIPVKWRDHSERVLAYGKRNRHLPQILQTVAVDSSNDHISDSVMLLPTLLAVSHQYTRQTTIRILFNHMLTNDSVGPFL
jgi:hypothetical protein